MESDLLSVVALDKTDLNDTGVERVQLVHDHFDVLIRELERSLITDLRHKVLYYAFSGAELE